MFLVVKITTLQIVVHGGSDTSANSSGTAQSNNNTRSQQSRNSGGINRYIQLIHST